jgi:hypothetical protein
MLASGIGRLREKSTRRVRVRVRLSATEGMLRWRRFAKRIAQSTIDRGGSLASCDKTPIPRPRSSQRLTGFQRENSTFYLRGRGSNLGTRLARSETLESLSSQAIRCRRTRAYGSA